MLVVAAEAASGLGATRWTLDAAGSTLTYQSVKKNTVVETNKLRNLSGAVSPDGDASVTIDLNSVDSGIDVRDVRMRFLFFQTFKFPVATVSTKIDPAAIADLPTKRRLKMQLPFTLDLHGFQRSFVANVVVTLISDAQVSVASESPIEIKVEDFGLLPAIEKLQQAGDVANIVPVASVSFDFLFDADAAGKPSPAAAAAPMKTDAAKATYTDEECGNRFDTISRSGAIYFAYGSAVLDPASKPLLATAYDVIAKCPRYKIEVSGHTDSSGAPADNLALSQRRADAVASFLKAEGIAAERLRAVGYGQTRPVAPNDSNKNRALNRRIEFRAEGTP
jgi:outer membrane protein OmpA-like peptidoglycan-associated protein